MAHEVENMFSVREVPWHGLGEIVQDAPSSEEAIKLAGLDWDVTPSPLMTESGIPVPGFFANMRSTDHEVYGVVSGRYKLLQNREAFNFMDSLIGGEVKYETAGSLQNGKRIWLLVDLGNYVILDDEVKNYICLTNSHDGKGSVKVINSPVRVVCANTLGFALENSIRSWGVRHSNQLETKLQEARNTLELNSIYTMNMIKFAEKKATEKFSKQQFSVFMDSLFAIPDESSRTVSSNIETMREHLGYIYNNAPDISNYRGTKWGVIQALTDHRTHRPVIRNTSSIMELTMKQTLDGDPWLEEAIGMLEVA